MKLHYAVNDDEWSKKVAIRYEWCLWPGCSSTFGLGAHHIIPRGFKELRLVLENGILLCTEHHNIVEAAKGTERYDTMMVLLAGRERYGILKNIHAEYLNNLNKQSIIGNEASEVTL